MTAFNGQLIGSIKHADSKNLADNQGKMSFSNKEKNREKRKCKAELI